MSEINFIGTPAKHGNYYIFHIPNKLIKKNLIDPDETYQLSLKSMKTLNQKDIKEENIKK